MYTIRQLFILLVMSALVVAGNPTAGTAELPREDSPDQQPKVVVQVTKDAPAFDFDELTERLRATNALNFFQKITLKRQVKDLVWAFERYHAGHSGFSLTELRARFNRLVADVTGQLRERDPELCTKILLAQDSLWTTLADPLRFAQL